MDNNYLSYTSDISEDKWLYEYKEEGLTEIREALSIKNTIPNVSALLFRRDRIAKVIYEHIDVISRKKIAGDWLTYCLVLEQGKIAFSPRTLNLHRRHTNSVTISSNNRLHLREILEVQSFIRERYNTCGQTNFAATQYANRIYQEFLLGEKTSNIAEDKEFFHFFNT